MTINSGEDVIDEVDILVLDKILRTFHHFFVMKVLLTGECDGTCKKIEYISANCCKEYDPV